MTAEGARQDMLSIRRTGLTLSAAERAFERAGLEVVERELFLVRPEYMVRYGLEPRQAGVLGRCRCCVRLPSTARSTSCKRGERETVR